MKYMGYAKGFSKRCLTWRTLMPTIRNALQGSFRMKNLMRSKKITPQLIEKIMLAVTAVNGCRYCSYFHATMAIKSGLVSQDVIELLQGDIGACNEEEAFICAFAQHWADSKENPSREMVVSLVKRFGAETAKDIIAPIQMITMGNLFGNTIDSFIARLQRKNYQKGSIGLEFVIFLFSLPVLPFLLKKISQSPIMKKIKSA
jgi:AhpD family alkylhydroperoxidase